MSLLSRFLVDVSIRFEELYLISINNIFAERHVLSRVYYCIGLLRTKQPFHHNFQHTDQ